MAPTARWLVLIVAAVATIGCDRVTKQAASAMLAGEPDRSYLAGTVRLGYAENTGGFLSLGADLPPLARTAIFSVGTGVALVALMAIAIRTRHRFLPALDLVLCVAGGLLNCIRRALHA